MFLQLVIMILKKYINNKIILKPTFSCFIQEQYITIIYYSYLIETNANSKFNKLVYSYIYISYK
jgi:hypothetical protein